MLRRSANIGDGSPKSSAILSHSENIADVSPMCLPVLDILNVCVPRRMFADWCALFGDISPRVLGDETSEENFNACIDIFLDVPMAWRSMAMTRVRCRSFVELLAHGDAQLCASRKHREA